MTSQAHRLERMFNARSVAIVGASETGVRARNAITAMSTTGVQLHLVNRRGETVMGRSTSRSLTELVQQGVGIDVAMVFTNKTAAIDVTAEAASLGVGGVIINAGGFAEAGAEGKQLQDRLAEAAGSMPLIGPNCNGIVAPRLGLHLAGSPPRLPIAQGRLAYVTHSGATMMSMALAGMERKTGYSFLVSTGNEAVVDMAEVIEFLATDPSTSAICLLLETVRNPAVFWAALDKAIAAGKPVLAIKNGRSSRGQAIAKSHTGAVAGEAWIYEAALRQHGVILANDLVDLADRAVLFDQVPRSKWTSAAGLAIASGSGGWVTMASDVCAEEGVELPALDELREQLNQVVPEVTVANPVDLTGAAMTDPNVMRTAVRTFVGSDKVDTLVVQSPVGNGAESTIKIYAGPALEIAPQTDKLIIVSAFEGGAIGSGMQQYLDAGVAVTRGLRATVRAIRAMSDFVKFVPLKQVDRPGLQPIPEPASSILHPSAGRMLAFAETMKLLAASGVPVAPYVVINPSDPAGAELPFAPPYVVKLADVPHRSDIGAVRLGVTADNLAEVVNELRSLAKLRGESLTVAVQPQYRISSELLVGINATSDVGPFVICGLGGVFVEILRQVSGRLAPFGEDEALRLVGDVNANGVLDGPRGTPPWPKDALAKILQQIGDLAVRAHPWIESLDINPLALTPSGIVAVDGLIILRNETIQHQ
jgi:acetate---CoA ligase (ADP-forming)